MIAPQGIDSEVVRGRNPQHTAQRHHMTAIWVGIDAGKTHHHCAAVRPHHDLRAAARHQAATDPGRQAEYRRWRPPRWNGPSPGSSTTATGACATAAPSRTTPGSTPELLPSTSAD